MTVDTEGLSSDKLFGKAPTDLQENIVVGTDKISGTLKYVADYSSAFSGDEAQGNFIALHCTANAPNAVIKAQVVNGVHGEVTLDEDKICIFRIADNTTQSIKFSASADGYRPVEVVFALSDLTLNNA